MPKNELLARWRIVESHLKLARGLLGTDADGDPIIAQFTDFLSENELGLACESLEDYAEMHRVSRQFWLALRDTAVSMDMPDSAARYASYAEESKHWLS